MIIYKTDEEIEAIARSCRIVARILAELRLLIRPGVETRELDRYAESRARELGSVPAFKGYRGYPASLCASVNEEIIHGIPSPRKLREGDIIGLDFGVKYEGYYGDAAITLPVGEVSPGARSLIRSAEKAFFVGFEKIREDGRISDISAAIQDSVERDGFSVIRSFVGHGIGHSLHEEPQVPNFGLPGHGPRIRKGLVLAIEPMIAEKDWEAEIREDGWTAVTRDGGLSAHFEHTVAFSGRGAEILSRTEDAPAFPSKRQKEGPHA